ncbi:hypothetical protein QBC43DRAFT_292630 [Cladorrhinum sp. PSN259]|nr:hypothetical protein QBC43DRAFT_292630 [Cladorrhinum sp. PSN259]
MAPTRRKRSPPEPLPSDPGVSNNAEATSSEPQTCPEGEIQLASSSECPTLPIYDPDASPLGVNPPLGPSNPIASAVMASSSSRHTPPDPTMSYSSPLSSGSSPSSSTKSELLTPGPNNTIDQSFVAASKNVDSPYPQLGDPTVPTPPSLGASSSSSSSNNSSDRTAKPYSKKTQSPKGKHPAVSPSTMSSANKITPSKRGQSTEKIVRGHSLFQNTTDTLFPPGLGLGIGERPPVESSSDALPSEPPVPPPASWKSPIVSSSMALEPPQIDPEAVSSYIESLSSYGEQLSSYTSQPYKQFMDRHRSAFSHQLDDVARLEASLKAEKKAPNLSKPKSRVLGDDVFKENCAMFVTNIARIPPDKFLKPLHYQDLGKIRLVEWTTMGTKGGYLVVFFDLEAAKKCRALFRDDETCPRYSGQFGPLPEIQVWYLTYPTYEFIESTEVKSRVIEIRGPKYVDKEDVSKEDVDKECVAKECVDQYWLHKKFELALSLPKRFLVERVVVVSDPERTLVKPAEVVMEWHFLDFFGQALPIFKILSEGVFEGFSVCWMADPVAQPRPPSLNWPPK